MEFLAALERSPFSVMLRETYFGFILPLTLHSISMGFFIGCSVLIAVRVLGFGSGIPLNSLSRLMPLLWLSLACSVVSGVLLLLAYPAKALTNWVFYAKMLALCFSFALTVFFVRKLPDTTDSERGDELPLKTRIAAVASVVLALSIVVGGRFLAYTYEILMASERFYLGSG